MANNFLTPDIVAKEALMVLQANLVMADLVHRDYDDEFVEVGDTIRVRKPAVFTAKNFTGQVSAQDANETSVQVKMDRFRDVTVNVTSKEMTLDIKSFSEQIVTPAMQAIAQSVDEDILAVLVASASYTKAGTTNPTNLADIADLAKKLDMNKVPVQNRRLVLNPEHKYRYALTDNLSKVSYAGTNETLRDALLGRIYTLETYMDQNAPNTSAATAGTATSYKVTGTKDSDTVALSNVSAATATIKAGDAFILNGYLYRFVADATAASGAVASVKLDQPLVADANNADVTIINAPHSVAFHRNGLAMVTRPLALPMGAPKAGYASADGLGVRVVFDYDSQTKKDKVSFDIIYGIKALDDKMIVDLKG